MSGELSFHLEELYPGKVKVYVFAGDGGFIDSLIMNIPTSYSVVGKFFALPVDILPLLINDQYHKQFATFRLKHGI
jgi:hypothetical protein